MVLPSSNVPETARITRIVHTPLQDGEVPQLTYTTSNGEVRRIAGEYGIRERPLPVASQLFPVRDQSGTSRNCLLAGALLPSWQYDEGYYMLGCLAQAPCPKYPKRI